FQEAITELMKAKPVNGQYSRINLGIWITAPIVHDDVEVIRNLAKELRFGSSQVTSIATYDSQNPDIVPPGIFIRDGQALLNHNNIHAVIFFGIFRNQPGSTRQSPVSKIVSACLAGKDVFVVLSAEDTVDWRPYLGEAAQKKGI